MMLFEKMRPDNWGAVIGQEKVVKMIQRLKDRGLGGRAFWISGKSGQGKTTIAHLLAAEIADDLYIEEIDASGLTPARLSEIEASMHLGAFGKGGRCWIFNESHGLRKDTIRRFLDVLERLPKKAMMIFTTTTENMTLFEEGLDSHPLLSRCTELQLTSQGLASKFAKLAKEIAQKEGLDGKPESAYLNLVNRCKSNMRQVLQEIEKGQMLD